MTDLPSVVLVGDEALLALELAFGLSDQGFKIIASTRSLIDAVRVADKYRPEFAVVDLELRDGSSLDALTSVLGNVGVRTVFIAAAIPDRFDRGPILCKPVNATHLAEALRGLAAGAPAIEAPAS